MWQSDWGMARGFSRTCKRARVILKLHRPLNAVITASELEPTSVFTSTFLFWFRTPCKKMKIILCIKVWVGRNILGNLRVRISDPWEKSSPRKIFEILFWLETAKNNRSRGGGMRLQVSLSSSQSARYLLALLIPELPIYFPELPFYFP